MAITALNSNEANKWSKHFYSVGMRPDANVLMETIDILNEQFASAGITRISEQVLALIKTGEGAGHLLEARLIRRNKYFTALGFTVVGSINARGEPELIVYQSNPLSGLLIVTASQFVLTRRDVAYTFPFARLSDKVALPENRKFANDARPKGYRKYADDLLTVEFLGRSEADYLSMIFTAERWEKWSEFSELVVKIGTGTLREE